MTIILPEDNSKEFELTPAGTHIATCYRVVDLGSQFNKRFNKVEKKIMLAFELTNEKMSDGRPFTKTQRFTLASGKMSNLRPFLESWRGVPFADADFGKFDLGNLIGKSCLMGILHNAKDGKTYDNISSVMRLPKEMAAPQLVNETIYFSLNDFKQELYDRLSEGLKAVIAKSPEYQHLKGANNYEDDTHNGHTPSTTSDEEIPF